MINYDANKKDIEKYIILLIDLDIDLDTNTQKYHL